MFLKSTYRIPTGVMKLTDISIKNAKVPPGKKVIQLFDGEGLFLFVSNSGSKIWRMAYRYNNKQNTCLTRPLPTSFAEGSPTAQG
jgi:hypothetical protein